MREKRGRRNEQGEKGVFLSKLPRAPNTLQREQAHGSTPAPQLHGQVLLVKLLKPQPCLCKGCPSTSRQVWFHLLWGHCSYPLGPGTQDFVSVLQEWNVSPALWKSAFKSCWPLKSDSLGIPNPFARSPGWESDLGLSTFTTVGEPLWYNCPLVCGPPTRRLWNWILLWLRTSYSLVAALSLDVGYLFRWVPAPLVDEC